jgi:glycosyltransferase involved in cell wall biosynthesis
MDGDDRQSLASCGDTRTLTSTEGTLVMEKERLRGSDGPDSHPVRIRVALLTGGADKPYALGLVSALTAQGLSLDFIGSDEINSPALHDHPQIRFLNLRGDQRRDVNLLKKTSRVLNYYARLIKYAATDSPKLFHILWNNKIEFFDRTLLLIYYRLLGKRLTFTAHNVNAAKRDGKDNFLNRLTLRIQYHLVHHIFVHTEHAARELATSFGVSGDRMSVIPFGINSSVPDTALTSTEAKTRLHLTTQQKVVLFFGNIAPYKGIEYLVQAMASLARTQPNCALLIVGRPKDCNSYWKEVRQRIAQIRPLLTVIERIEFVADEETEIYFKAADVLVLPYTHVFQSGVLSLGYNFGLPVIATDVGSLREDILSGKTGFVCRACDPTDLAEKLRSYFESDLYRHLQLRRPDIRDYANKRYSWETVAVITASVYRILS